MSTGHGCLALNHRHALAWQQQQNTLPRLNNESRLLPNITDYCITLCEDTSVIINYANPEGQRRATVPTWTCSTHVQCCVWYPTHHAVAAGLQALQKNQKSCQATEQRPFLAMLSKCQGSTQVQQLARRIASVVVTCCCPCALLAVKMQHRLFC